MNKQPSSTIMTRLCWGVFFLVLVFLGFQVIPRALGQRDVSKRSVAAQTPQSATGGLPGTRAPARPASPKVPAVRQSQLPPLSSRASGSAIPSAAADAAQPGQAVGVALPPTKTKDSAAYLPTDLPAGVGCAPGPWNTSTTGPGARYRAGGVTDGTYIYVFGGGDSVGGFYNDLWRWDPATETWTQLANMPTGKQNIQGAYWNGKIYVPGGFNASGHITENAIYDIATNTWTTGAPLPATQTGTNVAFNNKIYNFGGNPGPQSITRIYDIATNTWSTGASMPVATTYGRATVAGNFAYYVGGIAGVTTNAVYRYDFRG